MSKAKAKGGALELFVAKDLSNRYRLSFVRSQGSGAMIGGKNASRRDTLNEEQIRSYKGDVTVPPEFKRLNIECKSYATFSLPKIFTENNKQLDSWIAQVYDTADEGDINMIVINYTHNGKYICIENHELLNKENAIKYNNWYFYAYDLFFETNESILMQISGE